MKLINPSCRTRIYYLWSDTEVGRAIVYIGRTRGLVWKRVKDHSKKGWDFDDDEFTFSEPYSQEQAKHLEKALIEDFNPIYNKQYNSDCRLSAG